MSRFDVAVIGGGPGGYTAAIRAAQLGAKVALVEKGRLGGVCTNSGCIPSKTMIRLAEIKAGLSFAERFGITATMEIRDPAELAKTRNEIVTKLSSAISTLLDYNKVEVVFGKAQLKSANEILVAKNGGTAETVAARKIIIATGSKASPPMLLAKSKYAVTGEGFLLSNELPKSVLVVGGGPEGVEFACMLASLGCKVAIVEQLGRLLPGEDSEISTLLEATLKEKGVKIFTSATVKELNDGNRQQNVAVTLSNGEQLTVDKVIVCAGRKPNTFGIGVEKVKVKLDSSGRIIVNDGMETSVRGVYAIGDVTGGRYAHEAMEQGIVAAENAAGMRSSMAGKVVPKCTYSIPEVASVGMNEEDAKKAKKGSDVLVGRFYFRASGRAMTLGDAHGMVKVIIDKKTKKFLGIHMFADRASDMIGEAVLAMQYLDADKVINAIHPHPSLSEAVKEAVLDACGRPINSLGRKKLQLKRKQ